MFAKPILERPTHSAPMLSRHSASIRKLIMLLGRPMHFYYLQWKDIHINGLGVLCALEIVLDIMLHSINLYGRPEIL